MPRPPVLSLVMLLLSLANPVMAAPDQREQALGLLSSDSHADMTRGIGLLLGTDSELALPVLAALDAGDLFRDSQGDLYVRKAGQFRSVRTLAPASPAGAPKALALNNTSRRALQGALSRLRLTAKNVEVRREAARQLAEYPDEESTELIRALRDQERDPRTRKHMGLALAKSDLRSPSVALRLRAARSIQDSDDIGLESVLKGMLKKDIAGRFFEPDKSVRSELTAALRSIESRIFWINAVANTLYGLSLGSVLLLAALGLAITFGLMRVINMAHGEMLMLGAYSTYFVRELLLLVSVPAAEYYLAVAVPFAFITTFLAGVALERLVIRHLYGRPLETLLATWGLSLILIQTVRLCFGAQNVTVANPNWLSGGFELMPALVVPYARIAVLVFTALVVAFVAFILRGTSLGLKVRAVTQNREIAAGLGVATHKVDMWTFGLGSGLAGLGGVALSQLGNVGPELGQQHIIDSFVVVVVGGVGNILGTVIAGFTLGIASKVLEPSVGAVMGKILLLCLLILFIQWRPQGLFALKGRAAEG